MNVMGEEIIRAFKSPSKSQGGVRGEGEDLYIYIYRSNFILF